MGYFDDVLQRLVDAIESRIARDEFAAIVLISSGDEPISSFRYDPSDDGGQYPRFDPMAWVYPTKGSDMGNYIVGQTDPDDGIHAEAQILPQLQTLLQRFRGKHGGQNPTAIVLYTRIIPCEDCTEAIISTYRRLDLPDSASCTVYYYTYDNDRYRQWVKAKLEQNNICLKRFCG